MLYRVDLKKAEKIVNKAQTRLGKKYHDIQQQITASITPVGLKLLNQKNNINQN